MTHYVTNVCGWAAKTTKNVYSSVCTKGTDIAGYLHITSCAQACANKATQCWTDHNSELKYAIVAGSTAILTSGSLLVTPLVMGIAAFAVTKGIKHHAAVTDAVAKRIKNRQSAVSNFVIARTQKTRNIIHYWRSTNEQIHNEIVAAIDAKDIAKLLTLSKYTSLLSEEERSNAVIEFSKLPAIEAPNDELLSSLLNGKLNPIAIKAALKFAIQQNNPNLITILLRNNRLTEEQLTAAFLVASTSNTNDEVMNTLLSQGIDPMTPETAVKLRPALLNIAGRGFEKSFKTLLNAVNFTPSDLLQALNAVISNPANTKKVEFITVLNDRFPVDAMIKEHSCAFALSSENETLLTRLLSSEPKLTPDRLSRLIIHATTLPDSQFIQKYIFSLLKTADISDAAKSKSLPLFTDAVCNRHQSIDELSAFILTVARIDESDRKKAILTACMKGNTAILTLLLQGFSINRQFKAQLLEVCHPSIRANVDGLRATW
jgi:hypothetical protein